MEVTQKHIVDLTENEDLEPILSDEQLAVAREIIDALSKQNMQICRATEVLKFCEKAIQRCVVASSLKCLQG